MSFETETVDISSEVYSQDDFIGGEVPLLVFRVIGCTVVTLLVGFIIIIYVATGMFHIDCIAQICSEVCVFVAYMLILLTTTEFFRIDKGMCLAIAIFLHFLFLCASCFLLLEAMIMCQARISWFHIHISMKKLLFVGWLLPAAITGVSAIIWFDKYTTRTNCWLDVNQSPYWPTMIPLSVCTGLTVFLVLLTVLSSSPPIALHENLYKRAPCYRTTRWASFLIACILCMSWFFGVRAYNDGKENFFGAFTVSSILLGVCIFILRISTDDEMREKIIKNVLCCLVPETKVVVMEKTSASPKKTYVQDLMDTMANSKMAAIRNGIVSHR